jgi:uroporphyrinogen decarboxylase
MATDLGMAALSIGYLDLNVGFGAHQLATTGESRYAGGSLRTRAQLEARPQPVWEIILNDLPRKKQLVQQAGMAAVLYLPWCFHSIATSMGLEFFSMQLYDNFEFIKTCIQWVENRNREAIKTIVHEVQPDLVLFDGDCAFKTGLMVHPHLFRTLVFEETRQTVALLQALQIPYAFHTDGKLDEVLPLLIELGFAAIHGCESQANDLTYLVAQFGDQICLVGNMDVAFLSQAQPSEISAATRQMLACGLRKSRFIAACNTSPQDYIPDANYLTMIQAIQEFNMA